MMGFLVGIYSDTFLCFYSSSSGFLTWVYTFLLHSTGFSFSYSFGSFSFPQVFGRRISSIFTSCEYS